MKKAQITFTTTIEYKLNEKDYGGCKDAQEMLDMDLSNDPYDLLESFDDNIVWQVSGKVLD